MNIFPLPYEPFHILDALRHLAGRQGTKYVLIISPAPSRPLVQDRHHAGIRLRPDSPAEALPEFLLHVRNSNSIYVFPQIPILLLLRFLYRVRHRKREPDDDQRGHHVPWKIHALPAGTGCEQHRIAHLFKPHDLFLGVTPYLHHGEWNASPQKLVDTPHQ